MGALLTAPTPLGWLTWEVEKEERWSRCSKDGEELWNSLGVGLTLGFGKRLTWKLLLQAMLVAPIPSHSRVLKTSSMVLLSVFLIPNMKSPYQKDVMIASPGIVTNKVQSD